ncbi:MAG: phage holin family protein, partial [Proteiniphilum sp.]
IRDDIGNYITSTLELGKLEIYEKISLGTSIVTYGLLLSGVGLITLLFILITVALYLNELFQSSWMGFALVSAFAFLVLLILLMVKKPLKKKCTNNVVRFLMAQDDKDDKNNKR